MYCQIIKQYTPATALQYVASTLNIVQYRNLYSTSRITTEYSIHVQTYRGGRMVSVCSSHTGHCMFHSASIECRCTYANVKALKSTNNCISVHTVIIIHLSQMAQRDLATLPLVQVKK